MLESFRMVWFSRTAGTRPRAALFVTGLALGLVSLGVAGCSQDPGDTPTPDVSPGITPTPSPTPIPATPTPADVPGARAWELTDPADLMRGPTALNRLEDFMIGNDYLRAVIQKPGRVIGWGMFGGTLIDAAEVRPDGSIGPDAFGELNLFFNLSHSIRPDRVWVEDDGRKSGTAVIMAEGVADTFDIIQIEGATLTYGIPLPYDINQVFDELTIRTRYSLGPNDRSIQISTEFINSGSRDLVFPVGDVMDSGGDVEEFIPNPDKESYEVQLGEDSYSYTWGGFGEALFALVDYMAFFGDGVTYGYMPRRDEKNETFGMAVTVSGVAVTVLDSTNLLGVFTANPRANVTVPAEGSVTLERRFLVGRDVSSISDEYYRLIDAETGTLTGQVKDAVSGAPIPNTRIGIVANGDLDAAVTACYTDREGRYRANLPKGQYGVMAIYGFDFTQDSRPWNPVPVLVDVSRGQTTTQDLTLDRPGILDLTALDGNAGGNAKLPVKVTLYGAYTPPPNAVMDNSGDSLGGEVARISFLTEGAGKIEVKPGTYRVVVSRGVEYDVAEVENVVIGADQTTPLTVTLTRVLDTAGYVSADLHVHALNSPDSPVPLEDRVKTFVTEGVELLVPTDHDVVTDFLPTIEALGVTDWISSLPGVEATTFNMGHFNQYPLTHDPEHLAGGAIDWTDASNLPLNAETGEALDIGAPISNPAASNNLTASQMARAYAQANEGLQIAQVNHPRGDLGGHFTQVGLDLSQYGLAGETSADPANFRLPSDADLFDIKPFRVMEILNGTSMSSATELMNDWFALLNLGEKMGGTGVSDTHSRMGSQGGNSRTFIKVPDDDIISIGLDAGFSEDFANGLDNLNISFGTGLFITTELEGSSGESGIMGELVDVSGGQATLKIRVQAPSWSNFHTIEVFTNTVVTANTGGMSFSNPSELEPAVTLTDTAGFTVEEVAVSSTNPEAFRRETQVEVPLNLVQDSWVVVVVRGKDGELKPGLNRGSAPLAVANPIFADVDGNGVFTAPGQSFVLPPTTERSSKKAIPTHSTHREEALVPGEHTCAHTEEWTMLKALIDAQRRSVHRR